MVTTAHRYDFVVDTTLTNNTHNMTIAEIGRDKRVLDVGCSTGYLADFLAREQGCDVTGLEPDAASSAAARDRLGADRVITGGTELLPTFAPGSFDVVLFADVLEHLVDPGAALRDARRLLAPGGHVVASIPNVAHGDIRLLLLAGHFDYQRTGLLDSTHVRFLTRHTIPKLFARSGYRLARMTAKTIPLGQSEFAVNLDYFPSQVLSMVVADPHHADYQYVLSATPDDGTEPASFRAARGWRDTDVVTLWASSFSAAEGVRLALPVEDDDSAVAAAVLTIESQCTAAGVSLETVPDIELVRCSDDLGLADWTLIDASWDTSRLRAAALPEGDSFLG